MGKYLYVYYTNDTENAGTDADWGSWFGSLGDKVIDIGNPCASGGQVVYEGGLMDVQDKPVTGYSIISATSMAEATELAKGCPLVATQSGAVAVYEALPM